MDCLSISERHTSFDSQECNVGMSCWENDGNVLHGHLDLNCTREALIFQEDNVSNSCWAKEVLAARSSQRYMNPTGFRNVILVTATQGNP